MKRIIFVLFSLLMGVSLEAQNPVLTKPEKAPVNRNNPNDTTSVSGRSTSSNIIKNNDAKIEDYKFITHTHDTIIADTTLTIDKFYKVNYLRKEYFDVFSFSNVGHTYNTLSYDFNGSQLLPNFGARARHFGFVELEDVNYYNVPTPFTELMYKSTFKQGQLLESFFTLNTSEQFNFSLNYKGLRSLGKYQNNITNTGNFTFTTNYKTKNNKYNIRAHAIFQDFKNEENGGLKDEDLIYFESGNPEFKDRGVFDPNFEDADNRLRAKRFYVEQSYKLIAKKDSLHYQNLEIISRVGFTDKYYQFDQTAQNDFFGEAFKLDNLSKKVTLENFNTELGVSYDTKNLGKIDFRVDYNNFNYGYNALVIVNGETITNRLKGDIVSLGGNYAKRIGKFKIDGSFGINISGKYNGNYFNGAVGYNLNDHAAVMGGINVSSKAPNYNFLLYQSDYVNYNWQNNFDNVQTKQLFFKLNSNKWLDLEADYSTINKYTYFSKDPILDLVKPYQHAGTINYFRVKLRKPIQVGKFTLDNTIRYQKVIDGGSVLKVPEFVTRNTLYYTDHVFKKALFLQTGISFNYFTKYHMNAYDPLLAEFYVQNDRQLGGFPRLDFFINAKIKQTRIFLIAEHFNSSFTGYNYYSAPNHPYRDFAVRFGLVWDFFL